MSDKQDDPLAALNDEEVRVIAPDFTLKKLIGEDVDIRQILSAENVEKAQQVISEHKESFLEWVMQDIKVMEEAYRAAEADLAGSEANIKKLARCAFIIKSQAGTFGFTLATRVAKSLDDFCNQYFKPNKSHMIVVRKHIDILSMIFHKNITGDGATMGKELSDSLFHLIEKYKI